LRKFLTEEAHCREFVNADLVAAGLSPFAPDGVAISAGRLMLKRLRELSSQGADFSFETTLSGRAYVSFLARMRAAGYRIRLDFLWIRELDVARERVRERVRKGGHDIPEDVQKRRFHLGIRNLARHYRPLLHAWRLFDNTGDDPHLVAEEKDGSFVVSDPERIAWIERAASVRFMPDAPATIVREPQAAYLDEETRGALRALRRAFAEVVFENLRFGLPVIQYRNGRVLHTPAGQLVPLARRIMEVNGEFLPDDERRTLLRGTVWDDQTGDAMIPGP